MGCWSSNQEEVKNPRGAHGEAPRNVNRGGAGAGAGGGRAVNVRINNQNPGDPYCGTIDKIENPIPDSYVGEGIKRTHAYTIDLTEEQYEKWKSQFWQTRCEGDPYIWDLLKQACELEHKAGAKLLKDNNVTLHNNRLTFCYDSTGKGYVIPPACINEPVGFGVDKEKEQLEAKEEPSETVTLNLILRNASTFKDDEIDIKDSWSVTKLKEKYAKLKDVDDFKKIRLLYYGKELKDEFKLFHYEINPKIILIAVINNQLYDDDD